MINNEDSPLIKLRFALPGLGRQAKQQGKVNLDAIVDSLLDDLACKGFSDSELSYELDEIKAEFVRYVDADDAGFVYYFPKKNAKKALKLLGKILHKSKLERGLANDRYKSKIKKKLKQDKHTATPFFIVTFLRSQVVHLISGPDLPWERPRPLKGARRIPGRCLRKSLSAAEASRSSRRNSQSSLRTQNRLKKKQTHKKRGPKTWGFFFTNF